MMEDLRNSVQEACFYIQTKMNFEDEGVCQRARMTSKVSSIAKQIWRFLVYGFEEHAKSVFSVAREQMYLWENAEQNSYDYSLFISAWIIPLPCSLVCREPLAVCWQSREHWDGLEGQMYSTGT